MTRRSAPGAVAVAAVRADADRAGARLCRLIDEAPLVVEVAEVGRFVLMWTPPAEAAEAGEPAGFVPRDGWLVDGDAREAIALAAGFAFTEGLFDRVDELESIARCAQQPDRVRIVLGAAALARARWRQAGPLPAARVVRSSCGACGSDAIDHLLQGVRPLEAGTQLAVAALAALAETMQRRQPLRACTGAAHGALLFDPGGRPLRVAEDLGRHNALDKVIGRALLDGLPLEGGGVLLSSRLSFEMVAKAARARLAIVAGVSAPSALAVRTAHAQGITLCGWLRDGQVTVYTHPRRITVGAADRADAVHGAPLPAA